MRPWLKWLYSPRQGQRNSSHQKRRLRPLLELLEDRNAPAVLTVSSLADGAISGSTPTLSLREAVALVDTAGTATDGSGNSLAVAKTSQVSGSFGSNDTIQFDPSLAGG